MKKKLTTFILPIIFAVSILFASTGLSIASAYQELYADNTAKSVVENKDFAEYAADAPKITWEKYSLEYPEWQEGAWYESVEYSPKPMKTVNSTTAAGEEIRLLFYMPKDVMESTIMNVSVYQPDNLSGITKQSVSWAEEKALFHKLIHSGSAGVGFSGGIFAAIAGSASQNLSSDKMNEQLVKNSKYYCDEYYSGLPDDGFYTMDSMEITIENSAGYSVSKNTTQSYSTTAGGSWLGKLENEFEVGTLIAKSRTVLGTEMCSTFESALGFDVSIDNTSEGSTGNSVTRTFDKRDDKEIKNVAWRLVNYEATVTLLLKMQKKVINDDNTVEWIESNETYTVEMLMYKGIVREWANGYIEDWYSGELCFRADFFGNLKTEEQFIEAAKAKKQLQEG